MTVTKRSTGEYVILFENAAWANIMMTRWDPNGARHSKTTAFDQIHQRFRSPELAVRYLLGIHQAISSWTSP